MNITFIDEFVFPYFKNHANQILLSFNVHHLCFALKALLRFMQGYTQNIAYNLRGEGGSEASVAAVSAVVPVAGGKM